MAQRLSYDAWGLRRHPDGTPDPAGAIQSESTRGFTGHEHLAQVGLIHMNGRVYDPLLARFGTPDPMTEDPFSTQGWNRYSYVGNSPVNFTDPSGYCFMGCFWKPLFASIGRFFSQNWRAILQIAVTATCQAFTGGGPACAALGSFVAGVTSGNLGMALRSAAIAFVTAAAMFGVGEITGHLHEFMSPAHAANMAGHALVGCASAVAQGGRCGPGALSGAVGSFASPVLRGTDFTSGLVAHAVVGGLASVAGGGNFANGAVTAAFGYLFNQKGGALKRGREVHGIFADALAVAFGEENVRVERSFSWDDMTFRTDIILFDRDVFELKSESYTLLRNSTRYQAALDKMLDKYVPGLNAKDGTTRYRAGDFRTYFPSGRMDVLLRGELTGIPNGAVTFFADTARNTGLVFYRTHDLGRPN